MAKQKSKDKAGNSTIAQNELIALGYTNVHWYRGGWEAWDAHDLPMAPLNVQFLPSR